MALTKENAGKFLPIVQAMAEGKTIEFNSGTQWVKCTSLALHEKPEKYRIEQEPKLRPWKIKEVPVGALIRVIGDQINRYVITGATSHGWVTYGNNSSQKPCAFVGIYEHSLDIGKTWLPCGVME